MPSSVNSHVLSDSQTIQPLPATAVEEL